MKKYIIILFSILLLAGSLTNAQTIKRSKQKTKTEQPKTHNSSTSTRDKKTQKAKPSSSRPLQSATRSTEPTAYDVTFTCNVSNADMYIDDNDYGKPNGTRTLKTGSHQVKLVAEGYDDLTMTIQVNAESTSFDFKMTKESYVAKTININGVSFDMVFVEGGTFTMGATAEQGREVDDNEKPVHLVTVSDFLIGRVEVTQELWQAVMGSNPSKFKGNLNRPVESVSWVECQKFIAKLNQITGKIFRLPSEAEWEYAARGGKKSNGYKYSGSDNLHDVAWDNSNRDHTTHPVGTKSPNELGLFDLSGNVWEWCNDWKGSYESASQTNPTGPSSGSLRVNRGGSWYSGDEKCRVSYRRFSVPSQSHYYLGLRLAASSL